MDEGRCTPQHLAVLEREFAEHVVRCAALGTSKMIEIVRAAERLGHVSRLSQAAEDALRRAPKLSACRRPRKP